ncbi:hypothetical protein VC83_08755 [Pseudogymnoascus destructans]|uniref:Cell surface protein n=2 Tax=Pseudogymnoascus destructans TaxID=655981 RepID=L8G4K3_PSED2|nr:uncharacterized protein VC83_08755 [Pseudogymnoascus destructans]ELR07744.1 hypothetical protein GMDG_08541 [Pseudogymnoascus destructans 20631-21]OAF55017.1 hypothetical protein VC83_08755 [Pseudogymnoascus destructans]
MQITSVIVLAAFTIPSVYGHGVITEVQGANGVVMPGITVIDGTPRDCSSALCGAQADTAITRNIELGTSMASALGRTSGSGPVNAAAAVANFMGGAKNIAARDAHMSKRIDFSSFLGGAGGGATGTGVKTVKGTSESGVAAAAGSGAKSGLPTTADDGTLTMTFHQVNQDGAGPLTAAVDGTSGGTDPAAFKSAQVVQNVPGTIAGLSTATSTDFPVKIQMPAGMVCSATVAGVNNVCVAKLQNSALAGPFGGSVAFTQSSTAKKRAVEFNFRARRFARALRD